MENGYTPERFREALCSNEHTLIQLQRKLERMPVDRRADALLGMFADRAYGYREQLMAGELLLAAKTVPNLGVYDVLKSALVGWNFSVQELPLYLRETFGLAAVSEAVEQLAAQYPHQSQKRQALHTVCYWLKILEPKDSTQS
jgi:hypothetical protein